MAAEAALGILALLLTILKTWAAQLHPRRRPDRRRTHLRRPSKHHKTVSVTVALPGCGLWRRARRAVTL